MKKSAIWMTEQKNDWDEWTPTEWYSTRRDALRSKRCHERIRKYERIEPQKRRNTATVVYAV